MRAQPCVEIVGLFEKQSTSYQYSDKSANSVSARPPTGSASPVDSDHASEIFALLRSSTPCATTSVLKNRNTWVQTMATGGAKIATAPIYERQRFAIGYSGPISCKTNPTTAGAIIVSSYTGT